MGSFIAILRGINVSGARKLPMKELKALFEDLGARDVRTYIQSGNVAFTHAKGKPEAFARQVEERIERQFGYDVPVLVRSAEELKALIARNPYLRRKGIEVDKLHVTFLEADADPAMLEKIAAGPYGGDGFLPGERALYVHCPNGYGNTKLSNTFFEAKLKVRATTRNWRTVNELVRMTDGA